MRFATPLLGALLVTSTVAYPTQVLFTESDCALSTSECTYGFLDVEFDPTESSKRPGKILNRRPTGTRAFAAIEEIFEEALEQVYEEERPEVLAESPPRDHPPPKIGRPPLPKPPGTKPQLEVFATIEEVIQSEFAVRPPRGNPGAPKGNPGGPEGHRGRLGGKLFAIFDEGLEGNLGGGGGGKPGRPGTPPGGKPGRPGTPPGGGSGRPGTPPGGKPDRPGSPPGGKPGRPGSPGGKVFAAVEEAVERIYDEEPQEALTAGSPRIPPKKPSPPEKPKPKPGPGSHSVPTLQPKSSTSSETEREGEKVLEAVEGVFEEILQDVFDNVFDDVDVSVEENISDNTYEGYQNTDYEYGTEEFSEDVYEQGGYRAVEMQTTESY